MDLTDDPVVQFLILTILTMWAYDFIMWTKEKLTKK
jgi:hypothetical protein